MGLKRSLKSALTKIAHSREYALIPAWTIDRRPLAMHLRAICTRYSVDCIFDVGGNLGQFHDMLREEVGFEGWILSFEPVGRYIEILRRKSAADGKWRIFDFALGNANEKATIHVTKSPGLNSFLAPRTDVVQDYWSADAIGGTEEVQVRMLDGLYKDLRDEFGFCAPYLKLDTQGFDLNVLKGAANSLHDFRALQTEASIKSLYRDMPDYREMIAYLASAGFELSGMFPVGHDRALRLIEFDCVVVNREFAERIPPRETGA
jgi:FkbM family methyltransferase